MTWTDNPQTSASSRRTKLNERINFLETAGKKLIEDMGEDQVYKMASEVVESMTPEDRDAMVSTLVNFIKGGEEA